MMVCFYLAESYSEEDWMTILLFEAECCSALFESQTSKRPISLPLLHKMFWSNPKFTEFLHELPGSLKGFSAILKSYFPNIQNRTECFFLRSRFFTSNLFCKLCEILELSFSKNAQSSASTPKRMTPYLFDSAFGSVFDCISTIHVSLNCFLTQPSAKPVIQRDERQKMILIAGNGWREILQQFNEQAMVYCSQPDLLDRLNIPGVAEGLKSILNGLIRNQLDHDLELLEAEDDSIIQSQQQQQQQQQVSSSSQSVENASVPHSTPNLLLDLPLLKKYSIRPELIQNHSFFLPNLGK